MPPQITESESGSDAGIPVREAKPVKEEEEKEEKAAATKEEEEEDEEKLMVESEAEDDEEPGEDEFVVEKITDHLVDDATGELKYEVKWEGYSKKSDRTWEPEENLETASKVLNEYLASVGGKDAIMDAYNEKKANGSKGKKRSRQSAVGEDTPTNGSAKRGKKGVHPSSSSPKPKGSQAASFKPPSGSWEDAVVAIDACEGSDGAVMVYLTWQGGHKSQHPLNAVYKRCPQKMLQFYESHLVFKKNDEQ